MERVEALYKTNPEYFVYITIREALNKNSVKLLYKAFPEALPSKSFDCFNKKSFNEIRSNLTTPKYPVLFGSYYLFIQLTTKLTNRQIIKYNSIIDEMNTTQKEFDILQPLLRIRDMHRINDTIHKVSQYADKTNFMITIDT